MAESFRGLLLRHRARTGLSQRQLAARMGVGRRTVQDWESGLAAAGLVRSHVNVAALQDINQVFANLRQGRVVGRMVLDFRS